jgi:glycosyltransferase involved in cell wall biosynthesis
MMQQARGLPTLTVALVTVGARLSRVALPAPMPGVDYVVTVQAMAEDAALPDWSERDDVQVWREPSVGVSANRNAGLARATGDLVLFCDDDIRLNLDGITHLRRAFDSDPALALALGWREGRLPAAGAHHRPCRLTALNSGRAAPPEIMVRRRAVSDAGVLFDTGFGIGARYPLGEEYIFVTDLLAKGLKGRSFPVVTGRHDGPSSGDHWADPELLRARAAVLRRVFGPTTLPVRLAYAWRHRMRFHSARAALRFALRGR